MKTVIVCADDFAITPEVSEGIVLLAAQGRVTGTSVMSLSPHWESCSRMLVAVQEKIDIGLHIDFTSEFAIRAGHGANLGLLMFKSVLQKLNATQIERCLHHQLDLFEKYRGVQPQHIDGHQHVHQFPVIRDCLIKVLKQRYQASEMPWLRISKVPRTQLNLKGAVINGMGANALLKLAKRHQIPHANYLTGIYNFAGNAQTYMLMLEDCLKHAPDRTVLMCHPGLSGDINAPYAAARIWEQQVLQGEQYAKLLNSFDISLARGSQTLRVLP